MKNIEPGTILRLKASGEDKLYFRVVSIDQSSCSVVSAFRIRKGFLSIRFGDVKPSYLYFYDLNQSYKVAENQEIEEILAIIREQTGTLNTQMQF